MPTVLRDTDGLEDERRGVISVFDGPAPEVKTLDTIAAEADAVRKTVETWLSDGIAPHEIGVFVRTPQLVTRARSAIAGLVGAAAMTTAPMSLAKGLEFRAVVVMACEEGVLPLDERVADAAGPKARGCGLLRNPPRGEFSWLSAVRRPSPTFAPDLRICLGHSRAGVFRSRQA